MDIFESLENLNVSEECFDEIMGIVEEIINEVSLGRLKELANRRAERQGKKLKEVPNEYGYTYKHTMSAAQKAKANRGKSVFKPYPLEQAEKEAKKEPNYKLGVPIKLPPLK